jgi:hypothetical protein
MTSRGRLLPRLLLLAGLIPAASMGGSNVAAPSAVGQMPLTRSDSLRPPEVRLRKLHLVRPDLIPYPIEYEVVC